MRGGAAAVEVGTVQLPFAAHLGGSPSLLPNSTANSP